MNLSLLLIGCGKMGNILLDRWMHAPATGVSNFDIIDPKHYRSALPHAKWHISSDTLPMNYAPSIVVFAVKPHQIAPLMPFCRDRFGIKPLYISIAAGKNLAFFHEHLGPQAHIVRAMPNLPAVAGQGITAVCASRTVPDNFRTTVTYLMQPLGKLVWLEDESQMDAVTAISGCGPAYIFLFTECLIRAGVEAGLTEIMAKMLAVQTLSGSAVLAAQSPESLEQLRKNVTSPGGSTEAALKVLMNDNALENLMKKAVQAAAFRAWELSE